MATVKYVGPCTGQYLPGGAVASRGVPVEVSDNLALALCSRDDWERADEAVAEEAPQAENTIQEDN